MLCFHSSRFKRAFLGFISQATCLYPRCISSSRWVLCAMFGGVQDIDCSPTVIKETEVRGHGPSGNE